MTSSSTHSPCLVFIGACTGAKNKGIHVCRFDPSTGHADLPELAVEAVNPTFLAIHPRRRFLYAVGELTDPAGGKVGALSAFAIEPRSGRLALLNQRPSVGTGPCFVAVDKAGRHVLAANYRGGSVAVFPIQEDGRLGEPTAFVQHCGSGADPHRQEGPHAHSIHLDAANRFAFVADLGLDQILTYRFDAARGTLAPNAPPFVAVPPGSGPRHFAFHPGGRFAYVINELACTVTVFRYEAERGELMPQQTISTLPAGESVQPGYSTAEVAVHPSGGFLYGSNRGHDTLAVFVVDEKTGQLTPVEHQPSGGKIPCHFGIDPTGAWLLAANQNSDSIVVFRIDPRTGRLKLTGQTLALGTPVCVKFMCAD